MGYRWHRVAGRRGLQLNRKRDGIRAMGQGSLKSLQHQHVLPAARVDLRFQAQVGSESAESIE